MPRIGGASLLDILSQGGQFLGGRQAAQRQQQIEDQERAQRMALQQALLEQYQAQAESARSLAAMRDARMDTPIKPSFSEQEAKAEGQLAPFVNKPAPKGFDPVGAQVSDAIAHIGFENIDPNMLYRVAQERADKLAVREQKPPVRGTPEYEAMLGREQAITDGNANAAGGVGGTGKVTVAQRTARLLYTSGKRGYETLEGVLAEEGKNAPGWLEQQAAKLPAGLGNLATSDFVRQMNQGANQLADSWLRLTSGAAVPEPEVERFAAAFLPLAGDDQATAESKRQARSTIIEAMRVAADADIDVAAGLADAGIDPRDVQAVTEWIRANTGSTTPAGGGDLRSRFRARLGGGG